jgi:glutamate N-acetyltransferase/amino-acid N-acetyltransferase
MSDVSGAITYPKGFLASGVRAGIKQQGEDIALVVSQSPAASAGLFTTNVVKAASVLVSRERIGRTTTRAVVANSGNANACTGERGLRDARDMAAEAAGLLGVSEEDVLIASTGIIGRPMPLDKVKDGIAEAVQALRTDGGADAASAIMTTDTCPKEAAIEVSLGGAKVRIGGMAKGSGMICPDVATMLVFVTTDAAISPELLQISLMRSAEVSFNCLTVDGDSSTNDSVIALANGMAGNRIIGSEGADFDAFQKGLDIVTTSLAKQIAADGEGATKMIEITVRGAQSFDDARCIAKTVANSALVKTAMFGCDPNWGRVLAAAGRAGVDFDPHTVNLAFGTVPLVQGGEPVDFAEDEMHEVLSASEVAVILEVGNGPGDAMVWTCDFSYDYVRINAEYHT